MISKVLIFITFLGFVIFYSSCNSINTNSNKHEKNHSLIEYIKDTTVKIENGFKARNPFNFKVYIKTINSTQFIQLKDFSHFPDSVEETLNLYYDSSGKLKGFKDIPTSESGDYSNIITYYFNNDGNVIAYKTVSSFFGEDCSLPGTTITEKNFIYYGNSFKILKKEYSLTSDKKTIDSSKCIFNYRIDDKIYKSISEIPQLKSIKR
jgi:hypothetical protein